MFLRDLLQGAIGSGLMQGGAHGAGMQGGVQGEGQNPIQFQRGWNADRSSNSLQPAISPGSGLLRNMMMRRMSMGGGAPATGGMVQPAAPLQNNVPPQEDSYTASDYVQGSPSYNNGQVSLHGSFYNGGGLNGEDINQRRGGTIRF